MANCGVSETETSSGNVSVNRSVIFPAAAAAADFEGLTSPAGFAQPAAVSKTAAAMLRHIFVTPERSAPDGWLHVSVILSPLRVARKSCTGVERCAGCCASGMLPEANADQANARQKTSTNELLFHFDFMETFFLNIVF